MRSVDPSVSGVDVDALHEEAFSLGSRAVSAFGIPVFVNDEAYLRNLIGTV